MKPIDYDAVRAHIPELADATDDEIAEVSDYAFYVLSKKLAELRKRGAALLAERDERKAA